MGGLEKDTEYGKALSGSITGVGQSVDIFDSNSNTRTIQLAGTWSGTLVVEASNDNVTYTTLSILKLSSFTFIASLTVSGMYIVNGGGYSHLRVRSTAWTSGTVDISARGTDAASSIHSQSTVRGSDGTQIGNAFDALKIGIQGSDGNYVADVELVNSKRRLLTDAIVTVEEIFGQDPFPDTFFTIVNAGAAGTTIRVQVAATTGDPTTPDRDIAAVDLTYTLVAADVGDEIKLRDNIITYLNAQSSFSASLKAQKVKDLAIVHITSKFRSMTGEFYERPGVNGFQVTTTGATSVLVAFDNVKSRGKATSLARDPDSPHRLGILGISGSVTVTPGGISDLFIDKLLNVASPDMLVNGSVTPVTFTLPTSSLNDKYVQRLRLVANGNGIKFGQFLSQNSSLTTGLLIEIKSDNIVTTLPVIKSTDDLKHLFSFPPTGFSLHVQAGRDDLTAEFQFENPFVIRRTGTFTTDDYLKVTVRDNLTNNILYLESIAFGFEKEP